MKLNRNSEKPVCNEKSERTGSLYAHKALVIGLTGGIATGKTTVACIFDELGAKVVSADDIVHELLQPGTDVSREVVEVFGKDILKEDGSIDRRRLGGIVFRDPEKKARLEAIIHPHVIECLEKIAQEFHKKDSGVLILEIPLLIETSLISLVDKVLVVTVEQETQIDRLEKRYGVSREEAILRIKAQLPMSEKLKHADWVASTDGTLGATKEQVERIWYAIQKSLAQPK